MFSQTGECNVTHLMYSKLDILWRNGNSLLSKHPKSPQVPFDSLNYTLEDYTGVYFLVFSRSIKDDKLDKSI